MVRFEITNKIKYSEYKKMNEYSLVDKFLKKTNILIEKLKKYSLSNKFKKKDKLLKLRNKSLWIKQLNFGEF